VFVHDPLYIWGMTTAKAEKHRRGGGSEGGGGRDSDVGIGAASVIANADAERAISRVDVKLRGLDWNQGEALSVEGHVAALFQQAVDPANLAQHYVGWAAWL
jgi:phosphatidylinositol kinase/protein kinase (PI-3  family)